MALLSEVQERGWAKDKYGDNVLRWTFDWRDTRIMEWINNFVRISRENTTQNVNRLITPRTHKLERSMMWRTWAVSGGDAQIFEARYIYYAKYLELAVGGKEKYNGPVPAIPHKKWNPIPVPTRKRKGRPHIVTEMRSQAQKFSSFARAQLSFAGTMYMIYAMGSNKSASAAYNRTIQWALEQGRMTRE